MIRKHINPFGTFSFYLLIFTPLLGPVIAKAASSSPEFTSFKIILQRNIFDPNRTPFRENSDQSRKSRPNPQQTDRFTLLGVLIHNGDPLAFFEGSQTEFRREFKPGETIAGFRIAGISTEKVLLEKEGRKIPIPVGQGMSSTDGEEWEVGSGTGTVVKDDSVKNVPPENPAKDKGQDTDTSDLLKKMMERREKETGK
jgi:hypothetical protein